MPLCRFLWSGIDICCGSINSYNPFLVYCRELAPGTVSLTGDRAQGDDSKHDSHYCSFTISWLKETVWWILPLHQTREHGVGCILTVYDNKKVYITLKF